MKKRMNTRLTANSSSLDNIQVKPTKLNTTDQRFFII